MWFLSLLKRNKLKITEEYEVRCLGCGGEIEDDEMIRCDNCIRILEENNSWKSYEDKKRRYLKRKGVI